MYAEQLKCPGCETLLGPQEFRTDRPFSCPSCKCLLDPLPYPQKFGCVAALILLIGTASGLVEAGVHWLIAIGIGLLAAFAGTKLLFDLANHIWPRPPRLVLHDLRAEPKSLDLLADFLERIASADTWTSELDRGLAEVQLEQSFDDWLQNAAIEAAKFYRETLSGTTPAQKLKARLTFSREEQRKELCSIAQDPRLANKNWI